MASGIPAGPVDVRPDGLVGRPTRRRGGVIRRALRRQVSHLRERRRLVAILLLALAGGIGLAGMFARGELAGVDARAYWAAVRIWLNGGDPYHPASPFMPYVYAPWLLPVFAPWALLPWDVAWFVWRGGTIVLLLWTVAWAYRRHPLATAVTALLLAFPAFANLDTGNINLVLVLVLWGARFTGPRTGGILWALAVAMKWIPIVFLPILAPKARLHGVVFLAVAALLTLATFPLTLVQLSVLFGLPRPARLDYLVFLWALVPSLWLKPDPAWFLRPATWRAWAARLVTTFRAWRGRPRGHVDPAPGRPSHRLRAAARGFFGLAV
jgi:Glycosyltransferase family 87